MSIHHPPVVTSWACTPVPECMSVDLAGLRMSGKKPRDGGFGLTGWEGWQNGPDVDGGPALREYADGAAEGRVIMLPRRIRLEGLITTRSRSELWQQSERLGAILTRTRWDWLTVTDNALGLTRRCWVTRDGRHPQITTVGAARAVFTLELVSNDWRRFSTSYERVSMRPGETATLRNVGNVDGDLLGTLTGPLTNPSISWGGNVWRYNGTVAAGQTLGVDFGTRVVRDPATAARYRRLVSGPWPAAVPGSVTYTAGGTGTGSIELRSYSAWS